MHRRTLRWSLPCALAVALSAAPGAGTAAAFTMPPIADELSQRIARAEARADARAERRDQASDAVRAARAQIGKPYAMGASGPGAFDCSGLTIWALRRAGVALPHSSFAQFALGDAVERSEIRRGDLVFFDTSGPGASHVGVATGRDTVVSATSSGVMEHPSTDAYWGAAYVGARRVG